MHTYVRVFQSCFFFFFFPLSLHLSFSSSSLLFWQSIREKMTAVKGGRKGQGKYILLSANASQPVSQSASQPASQSATFLCIPVFLFCFVLFRFLLLILRILLVYTDIPTPPFVPFLSSALPFYQISPRFFFLKKKFFFSIFLFFFF